MQRSWLVSASAALIALAAFAVSSFAAQYEAAPTFSAAQALPGIPLRGADYSIGNSVPVENFQYVFSVNTKWGPFRVKGSDLMRVRLREIGATGRLEQVNGAETAVESAGKTALRPLNTAKDLVTQPGQTISDTFRGVGHIFGSADATMNATDPHGDSMIASVTGGASARRKNAFNLGVDPNTTFPPLADQLKRVATASAFGETSANVGMSFVAGPAGFAIGATGTAGQVREMLRDSTPADLEKEGRALLAAMGVSQAAMDAFYDIIEKNNLTADDIKSVKVVRPIGPDWTGLFRNTDIGNIVDAQFSIPYNISCAAHRIKAGVEWQDIDTMRDPKILGFMKKVSVTGPEALTSHVGTQRIEVEAKGKTFAVERNLARGGLISSAGNEQLTDEELEKKFKHNAARILSEAQINRAVDTLWNLEKVKNVKELIKEITL